MSGRGKDFSEDFMVEDAAPAGGPHSQQALERERDPHRLAQRQKQIDLGKNTIGYQRYRDAVPRDRRDRKTDPMTPDVYQVCSKRAFDGQVKKWRRQLHAWDLPEHGEQQEADGQPALLPVHQDTARQAQCGPNPPAPDHSDDFEHISHADAAASPKNGARLRSVGNLPLKIPSAMRKRPFDETTASSENLPSQQQIQHLDAHTAQPARLQPDAKHLRRSTELPPGQAAAKGGGATAKAAMTKAAAQSGPSCTDGGHRYRDPELCYSLSSDEEDGGWQHIRRKPAGRTDQNNPAAQDWEEEVQV